MDLEMCSELRIMFLMLAPLSHEDPRCSNIYKLCTQFHMGTLLFSMKRGKSEVDLLASLYAVKEHNTDEGKCNPDAVLVTSSQG